jgi:UDP-N-acetylglucosamine 2-epimerase
MSLTVLFIVDSRSGLIKVAAIREAIEKSNARSPNNAIRPILLDMRQAIAGGPCATFFNDAELPAADIFLSAPAGVTFTESTALVGNRFSAVLARATPDVVMITGNSDHAVSCAVATKSFGYARVRAGARIAPALAVVAPESLVSWSSDSRQVNTGTLARLADYVFVSDKAVADTLLPSRADRRRVYAVGSLEAEAVLRHWKAAMGSSILADLQLDGPSQVKPFALLALRQPPQARLAIDLQRLQPALSELARQMPVVCPADDTLLACIRAAEIEDYFVDHFVNRAEGRDRRIRIRLIPLLGYLDFIKLVASTRRVLTDCREVQLQASVLGVPCTALCQGIAAADIRKPAEKTGNKRSADAVSRPSRDWRDGRAAERILKILQRDCRLSPTETFLPEHLTQSRL